MIFPASQDLHNQFIRKTSFGLLQEVYVNMIGYFLITNQRLGSHQPADNPLSRHLITAFQDGLQLGLALFKGVLILIRIFEVHIQRNYAFLVREN